MASGGASAVKEPGSFRDQKILGPGHPDAPFSSKKLTTFLIVALKTQAATLSPSK